MLELFDLLEQESTSLDAFCSQRYYISKQSHEANLWWSGNGCENSDHFESSLDSREKEFAVASLTIFSKQLEKLLWYAKVNSDAIQRILAKLKRVVPEQARLGKVASIYTESFIASPKACIVDFERSIEKITILRQTFESERHHVSSSSLGENGCSGHIEDKAKRAILDDDIAGLKWSFQHEQQTNSMSKNKPTLAGLLQYSILHDAKSCISWLHDQDDGQQNSSYVKYGNLLHRLIIISGQMQTAHSQISHKGIASLLKRILSKKRHLLLQKDFQGRLPLHYAAKYGMSEVCRELLEFFDVPGSMSVADAEGRTPLHLAIAGGCFDTMDILISAYSAHRPNSQNETAYEATLNCCLMNATQFGRADLVQLLVINGADAAYHDGHGKTPLYLSACIGSEAVTQILLTHLKPQSSVLNLADGVSGRTPLISACIGGHFTIVKLLLEAGADQNLCDLAGWTAKDHANFRGHLRIAKLLCTYHESRKAESQVTTMLRSLPHKSCNACSSFKEREPITRARIHVMLGRMNTRKSNRPIELKPLSDKHPYLSHPELGYTIEISAIGADGPGGRFALPVLRDLTNEPLEFSSDAPDDAKLIFNLFRRKSPGDPLTDIDNALVGRGIAILRNLKESFGAKHESLYRDYTIPLLNAGSLDYIGNVTFSFLVATPFPHVGSRELKRQGFWLPDGTTQVIGHRGSGSNTSAKSNIQIGENTVQSFLTANALGASCVEFDVQLTKDFRTVVFHDFLVMATGGNVPLYILTFNQFMHLARAQPPTGDLSCIAERRYFEKSSLEDDKSRRPRSSSQGIYDESTERDLVERMRFTEEGEHNDIKGNMRGYAVHEPTATLEKLLSELPSHLAFNVEISKFMLFHSCLALKYDRVSYAVGSRRSQHGDIRF